VSGSRQSIHSQQNTAGQSAQTQHKGSHPHPPPPSAGTAAGALLFVLSLGHIASTTSAIDHFATTGITTIHTSVIDQIANYSVELFIAAIHSTADASNFYLFISPFTGHFSHPHFFQFPFSTIQF
jgi:hypothetical protein